MKIVIAGTDSVSNLGDQAIVLSIMDAIRASTGGGEFALLTHRPQIARERLKDVPFLSRIEPVGWSPKAGKPFLINALSMAGSSVGAKCGPSIFLPTALSTARQLIKDADLLVITGGRHLNSPYSGGLLARLMEVRLAVSAHVPVVAYSQSIGPFRTLKEKIIADRLFHPMKMIAARDRQSLDFLHHFGTEESKIIFAPDCVFNLKPAEPIEAEHFLKSNGVVRDGRPLVAISARPLIGTLRPYTLQEQEQYLAEFAKALDAVANEIQLVFLSSTYGAPGYQRHDPDTGRQIQAKMQKAESLLIVDKEPTARVLKAAYGCMDAVVTTRMHPIIMTSAMHVPVVAISYEYKSRELMQLLELSEYELEVRGLKADELVSLLRAALSNSDSVKSHLTHRVKVLADQALAPAHRIAELLAGMPH